MSELYRAVQLVEHTIRDRGLDECQTRGLISLHSGVLTAIVTPNTPDDPQRLAALRRAAERVFGRPMPF